MVFASFFNEVTFAKTPLTSLKNITSLLAIGKVLLSFLLREADSTVYCYSFDLNQQLFRRE